MPHLPPSTIAEALQKIQRQELVLPAIQREFVWKPAQITALFDSIMRGYPIGSFLAWRVEPKTAQAFRFYGFMRDYNALNARHNPALDIPVTERTTAVLDGQQRLTSLNVGLRGTYAWKNKYGWSRFIENYPPRTLHLNLGGKAEPNAAGLQYDFRFLSQAQLDQMTPEERRYWLAVPDVYRAEELMDLTMELADRDIGNDKAAQRMAGQLWQKVHSDQALHFYEEIDQDIERVLDIFIRVNSGGTVLSYSDLLLSIATSQWQDRDARAEIHGLVDELNTAGAGFRFTKDNILKAALALAGVNSIQFEVRNFTADNMSKIHDEWDRIVAALRVAVGLLDDFGLSGGNLAARSIMIPIALYVHHRGLDQSYRESVAKAEDRRVMRWWTMRSLLVPGIWGSGLDGLLQDLRSVIERHGEAGFPAEEMERAMAARGKSLAVTPDLVDSLLELGYGDPAAFALLTIVFPHVNTRNLHHVDHAFPKSALTKGKLTRAGIDEASIDEILDRRDALPNLQLLEGNINVSKSAKLPAQWAREAFPDPESFTHYLELNALPPLPEEATEFLAFFEARQVKLRERLLTLLGASADIPASDPEEPTVPSLAEAVEGATPLGGD